MPGLNAVGVYTKFLTPSFKELLVILEGHYRFVILQNPTFIFQQYETNGEYFRLVLMNCLHGPKELIEDLLLFFNYFPNFNYILIY